MKRFFTLIFFLLLGALLLDAQDSARGGMGYAGSTYGYNSTTTKWDAIRGHRNAGLMINSGLGVVSASQSTAYVVSNGLTNPGSNEEILELDSGTVSSGLPWNVHLDQVTLTSSGAADIVVELVSPGGATCTSVSKILLWSAVASAGASGSAAAKHTCTANPTVGGRLARFFLPANGSVSLDLRGVVLAGGISGGQDPVGILVRSNAAVTGVVSASITFYEKQ